VLTLRAAAECRPGRNQSQEERCGRSRATPVCARTCLQVPGFVTATARVRAHDASAHNGCMHDTRRHRREQEAGTHMARRGVVRNFLLKVGLFLSRIWPPRAMHASSSIIFSIQLQHHMRTRHCDVYVSCCACPCSWQGTLKWAIFEVENAGTHEAMMLIDIRSEPKVRSCSRMFNKEFGSSHPGPADVSFFATGRFVASPWL
jgi:hypothetical protein